jgi:3D (Asp-Asp-Asp) domain-containing protein
VRRGERTWGLPLVVVLCGIAAAAVLPTSGPAGAAAHSYAPVAVEAVAPVRQTYRIRVDAVAYHLPGKTASGLPVGKGVVAVDPRLIPLGTRLFVPGYGRGVAADVGVAIKGRIIDLWMSTHAAARRWGRKTVTITVYR